MSSTSSASTAQSKRLRELIRGVRACKTAQEERSVINQETAAIRDNFKGESGSGEERHRSIMKLIFITLLGYKTEFGQVQCIKLLASSNFREKRIGYLGLTQILWETSEILLMVTQSIKRDLQTTDNVYVVSLALGAIGEISNNEMCRELYTEILKLAENKNPVLRQKALTAAVRIIRKLPDTIDEFVEVLDRVMSDCNAGVLLGALSLLHDIFITDPSYIAQFKDRVPFLVKQLKNLTITGYSNEYEVSGVKDPFLQVKILQCLKILGEKDPKASDEMSDVLAQLVSNIDSHRNAANTVIYEAVRVIMTIESSHGLRVYGINILSRFLQMKDNNLRFIALSTLQNVVNIDRNAVQRHKETILACIKDNDIAIKRRALDLLVCIADSTNVKSLVKELGQNFQGTDMPFLEDLANAICEIAEKYSPSVKFHLDSALKVFAWAGHVVKQRYASELIRRIAAEPEIRTYAVFKAFHSLTKYHHQNALAQLAGWLIGEYGHLIIGKSFKIEGIEEHEDNTSVITENDVFELISRVLEHFQYVHEEKDIAIIEYTLNCLGKLSVRYPHFLDRVQELLEPFTTSYFIEIQQRACEYLRLLEHDWSGKRENIFERIPEPGVDGEKQAVGNVHDLETHQVHHTGAPSSQDSGLSLLEMDAPSSLDTTAGSAQSHVAAAAPQPTANAYEQVMSLLDLDMGGPAPVASSAPPMQAAPAAPDSGILSMLGPAPAAEPTMALSSAAPTSLLDSQPPIANLMGGGGDDFGGFESAPAVESLYIGFEDANLRIEFKMSKDMANPNKSDYCALFSNLSGSSLQKAQIQVAGLKYLKVTMKKANKEELAPLEQRGATQEFSVINAEQGTKKIVLRIKVLYWKDGQQCEAVKTLNDIPQ